MKTSDAKRILRRDEPELNTPQRYSVWFVAIVALFVTSLVTANIIAVKLVSIAGLVFPAGVIIFPASYVFGDVLTEVYGYRHARRVIWLGFACNGVALAAILFAQILPPAPFWQDQTAYERILGYAPRLLCASFAAYLAGEFVNSTVLAKLKIASRRRRLSTARRQGRLPRAERKDGADAERRAIFEELSRSRLSAAGT